MNDIVQLIIIVLLLFFGYKFISWFSKRTLLLTRIYGLKKTCNANISLQSFPYRPMWMASKKPDIIVEILDTVYLIRIYSGGGISRNVHFANECFSATYISTVGGVPTRRHTRRGPINPLVSGLNIGARVIYTEPLDTSYPHSAKRKRIIPVLLLNPAPASLSYVTEKKTSIQIAFTGDDMYGMKVFTASTFAIYADRMKREEIREKEERARVGHPDFDYFDSF